jgi:hypothetical protein
MAMTATVLLLLSLLLQTHPPVPVTESAKPPQQSQTQEGTLSDDVAKIIVFPSCADMLDELTRRRRPCPLQVVYELTHSLSEGHLEVFNLLHVEAQYPLPDLSAGKHILDITDMKQYFYWPGKSPDEDQTLPDPMLFCSLGTSATTISLDQLWEKTIYSGSSVYDYKPPPPAKKIGDPGDLAAASRGDDLGFAGFNIPYKHNLELRDSNQLPEVEILGVGFVEGTPVECGKGGHPERLFKSPLRDVRVVSTVSHDDDKNIPVLKAATFTVPSGVFTYRRHIRIVGKLTP